MEDRSLTKIFVFGSNLAGKHGKGAALHAKEFYGAVYGVGEGPTGRAYALPTKDRQLRTLALDEIETYVSNFNQYVKEHPKFLFLLTPIGTGLAGYSKRDIMTILKKFRWPENVVLTASWINE